MWPLRVSHTFVLMAVLSVSGCLASHEPEDVEPAAEEAVCSPVEYSWRTRASWDLSSDPLAAEQGDRAVSVDGSVVAVRVTAYQDGVSVQGNWTIRVTDAEGRERFAASYAPEVESSESSSQGGFRTHTWSPPAGDELTVQWALQGFIEHVVIRMLFASCT